MPLSLLIDRIPKLKNRTFFEMSQVSSLFTSFPSDDHFGSGGSASSHNFILCFLRIGSLLTHETASAIFLLFRSRCVDLLLELFLFVFDQFFWISNIFALVEILAMSSSELLHHKARLICVFGLIYQFFIFTITRLLQRQMRPLLPLLVYVVLLPIQQIFLGDFLARLILTILNNFALSIDFLQHVPLLNLVPLHYRLSFHVIHGLVIWNQIHGDIFKESSFVLVPQRRGDRFWGCRFTTQRHRAVLLLVCI